MNPRDPQFSAPNEARLKYGDADFQIVSPGDHVRCSVTHQPIRLDDLKYWSVARQEAYASAEIAFRRHLEADA